jgi:hypothetical protein
MMNMEQWLALDEERRAACWLSVDLWCCLRDQCEMLMDSEYFESSLRPLPHGSTLVYEEPSQEEMNIFFHCRTGDYRMRVTFDLDLLCVRYTIIDDAFPHELLVTTRRGTPRFETHDRVPLSARELSLHMLMSLTYGRC